MTVDRMKTVSRFSALTVSSRALLFLAATTALTPFAAFAQTLPTGGSVAHGGVAIQTPSASQMTITQSTDTAIVNWNSFSIGQGAHVDIHQPDANAAILNRVTGTTTSQIHGQLTANGQVHLVNPNGIFIGATGTVDSGAFVASTLDISDEDFASRRLRYSGSGASAAVENAGQIRIAPGGYAALLGGRVSNSGFLTVPMGRVGFGAGERVTLDLSGDQFLQVALPSDQSDDMRALIDNSGTVSAEGGLIEMRAAVARDAARNAVNLSGIAEARSVSGRSGSIVLGGGGGKVRVSGQVKTAARAPSRAAPVESRRPQLRGGDITITGREVELAAAQIDASGEDGLIRIGGDFGGNGPLPRAEQVRVDAATSIRADAGETGTGGRIVIWSDLQTTFEGQLSARGGTVFGDGGFIEVSSAEDLRYRGLADLRAENGGFGTLLLDPTDITVPGSIDEATLEAQLSLGNVTLDTDSENSDLGDITINVDIDWTAATTLTLIADNNVIQNGSINNAIGAGSYVIDAAGTVTLADTANIIADTFRLERGTWRQVGILPSITVSNFQINTNQASFLRATGGTGTAGDPYLLTDIYGLQGMNSPDLLTSSFRLANDIDASPTINWVQLDIERQGFIPIALNAAFTGGLDGDGFTIRDLFQRGVPVMLSPAVGLFDVMSGQVTDLTIANADISGVSAGIVAVSNSGTISGVQVSGTSAAFGGNAGGIVAVNDGTITDSVSTASVQIDLPFSSGAFTAAAGGIVGINNSGTISNVSASGSVSISNADPGELLLTAGGVVGELNGGTIQNASARGNVTLTDTSAGAFGEGGGFVGAEAGGIIQNSFSTGSVTDRWLDGTGRWRFRRFFTDTRKFGVKLLGYGHIRDDS